jgi:gamma-glutamylputrescine oxidase
LTDVTFEHVWGSNRHHRDARPYQPARRQRHFAPGFPAWALALTGRRQGHHEAIAGTAERFDVFARLPHTTFHGGKLRADTGAGNAVIGADWM